MKVDGTVNVHEVEELDEDLARDLHDWDKYLFAIVWLLFHFKVLYYKKPERHCSNEIVFRDDTKSSRTRMYIW